MGIKRVPSRSLSTTIVAKDHGQGGGFTRPQHWEAIEFEKGNDDPYGVKVGHRHARNELGLEGTKENPIIVEHYSDWEPTRCACGHWFQLKRTPYQVVSEFAEKA